MPQLDISSYFSQYFYLTITFIAGYYFVTNFFIPNAVSTTKLRKKLMGLGSDLGTIEHTNSYNKHDDLDWLTIQVDLDQIKINKKFKSELGAVSKSDCKTIAVRKGFQLRN